MGMGILFIITGPSGAGKTSILKRVMKEVENLEFSVSYTTRPRRPGEVDGRDYFFVDEERFKKMVEEGEFLEWAIVHGYYYGTSKKFIDERLEKNGDLLLDIDVQGALNVKRMNLDMVSVFIAPPSLEDLEKRLRKRGTDSEYDLKRRLEDAKWELSKISEFEYLIVNDFLEKSVEKLKAIIIAERMRTKRIKLERLPFFQ